MGSCENFNGLGGDYKKNDDDNHINVEDEYTRYAATDDGGDDDDPYNFDDEDYDQKAMNPCSHIETLLTARTLFIRESRTILSIIPINHHQYTYTNPVNSTNYLYQRVKDTIPIPIISTHIETLLTAQTPFIRESRTILFVIPIISTHIETLLTARTLSIRESRTVLSIIPINHHQYTYRNAVNSTNSLYRRVKDYSFHHTHHQYTFRNTVNSTNSLYQRVKDYSFHYTHKPSSPK